MIPILLFNVEQLDDLLVQRVHVGIELVVPRADHLLALRRVVAVAGVIGVLEHPRQVEIAVAADVRQDARLRLLHEPPRGVAVLGQQGDDLVDRRVDVRLLALHAADIGEIRAGIAGSDKRHQVVAVDDRGRALDKSFFFQITVGHDHLHRPDGLADERQRGAVGDHIAVDGDAEQQVGNRPAQVLAAHLAAVAIGIGEGQVICERAAILAVHGILVDVRHCVAVQGDDRHAVVQLVHHHQRNAVRPRRGGEGRFRLDVVFRVNAGVEDGGDAVVIAIGFPIVLDAPVAAAHVHLARGHDIVAPAVAHVPAHPHRRGKQQYQNQHDRHGHPLVPPQPSLEAMLQPAMVPMMVAVAGMAPAFLFHSTHAALLLPSGLGLGLPGLLLVLVVAVAIAVSVAITIAVSVAIAIAVLAVAVADLVQRHAQQLHTRVVQLLLGLLGLLPGGHTALHDEDRAVALLGDQHPVDHGVHGRRVHDHVVIQFPYCLNQRGEELAGEQLAGVGSRRAGEDHVQTGLVGLPNRPLQPEFAAQVL